MTILLYLFAIGFLIVFPSDTADAAYHALQIFATSIVPVLFPYMVFSRYLCQRMDAGHSSTIPMVAVLGLLGGSPSGAAMISAHRHHLSQKTAHALCALSGTVSPMFIMGTIRSWTGQDDLCRQLLMCHWLAALSCAYLIRFFFLEDNQKREFAEKEPLPSSFNPISQSIDAVLQVGGCVVLYSVWAGIIGKILRPLAWLQPIVHALLEISGGIHAICQSTYSPEIKHILISAALGFNGLSILSQNYTQLRPVGIRLTQLIEYAVLRSSLCALFMTLLLFFS